ncbi:hypothetical protein YC2023_001576 [Brassica napus]
MGFGGWVCNTHNMIAGSFSNEFDLYKLLANYIRDIIGKVPLEVEWWCVVVVETLVRARRVLLSSGVAVGLCCKGSVVSSRHAWALWESVSLSPVSSSGNVRWSRQCVVVVAHAPQMSSLLFLSFFRAVSGGSGLFFAVS